MSKPYGDRPPWHDAQLRIQGPAVGLLDTTFRERWNDPAPLDMLSPIAWIEDKLRRSDLKPGALPEQPPDPPPCGPHAVQVLRTYPDAHFEYDFAPHGERSIARGYTKAVARARRLIYLEDQYLWSMQVAHLFADGDLAGGLRNLWDIRCLVDEFGTDGLDEEARVHGLEVEVARALRLVAALFDGGAARGIDRLYVLRLTARDDWGRETRPVTRFVFYVRSHWLRMPPAMLARHLWTKWRKSGGA